MPEPIEKVLSRDQVIFIMQGYDPSFRVLDEWIEIKDYHIKDSFIIYEDLTFSHRIRLENCTFHSYFSLGESIFEEYVEFVNCKLSQSLLFLKGSFEKNLRITYLNCDHVHFDGGNYQNIDFSSATEEMSIWINGADFKEFNLGTYIGSDKIKELIIFNNGLTKGRITIKNKDIKKIYIHGSNKECEYVFEEIKTDHFHLSNFINEGSLSIFGLSSLNPDNSYFEISKSNLGKTQLHRIDFTKFTEVIVLDSYLSEANLINCDWHLENFKPMSGPSYGSYDKNRKVRTRAHFNQLKETFRQLKYIYEKQGDKINEQLFYSFEMKTYNRKLRWSNPFYEKFWEKLILVFSEHLTSYGASFLRPLMGLLIANGMILLILISFHHFDGLMIVPLDQSDSESVEHAFGIFFILLNPLHKVNDYLDGWEIMWDLISRVISSYFIYALIKSSRRFLR